MPREGAHQAISVNSERQICRIWMDGYTDMLELMSSDREKDRSISHCSCKGPSANKIGVKKSGAGIE